MNEQARRCARVYVCVLGGGRLTEHAWASAATGYQGELNVAEGRRGQRSRYHDGLMQADPGPTPVQVARF